MAKGKGNLRRAVGVLWQTRPSIMARLVIYGVFFFATIGYLSVATLLISLAKASPFLQVVILIAVVGAFFLGRRYLRRYLTFVGHVPHLVTMVEALRGHKLPKGDAQIQQSVRRVEEELPESKRLLQLDSLIGRVLRDSRDKLIDPAKLKPVPGFNKLPKKVINLVLQWALNYQKDAVLGYALDRPHGNVWKSSQAGLAIYAESANQLARTAVRLHLMGALFGLAIVGLFIAVPGQMLFPFASNHGWGTMLSLSILLVKSAWVLKVAVYHPFGLAYMLSAFLRLTETQEPDAEWIQRLDEYKRYQEIGGRGEAARKKAGKKKADDGKEAEAEEPVSDVSPDGGPKSREERLDDILDIEEEPG
jgi:membrane protein implicated in regulation of membrane protease activity